MRGICPRGITSRVQRHTDRRVGGVRLHGAIQTSVFNRLLCACDWVGRSTQNVVTRILVNFRRSGVADSTGPAFKTVKRKTPSLLRPASFGLGPERPLLEIASDGLASPKHSLPRIFRSLRRPQARMGLLPTHAVQS